ncbi:MAG TPA: hypothetical protein VLJ10_02435 [Candidatus Bathyarchaeia archaeon]|nr:hypothetical protein [Candidatus Bathyarchaeia archaeon]
MDEWSTTAQAIDWNRQVWDPLESLAAQIVGFIPTVVTAVGIVFIGWLVALVIRALMKRFLVSIRFDQIAEHTGMAEVLTENKIKMTPSAWVSTLFYWFGIFMAFMIALDRLCLRMPMAMFKEIGDFFSVLFMGLFMILTGLFFSAVISSFVEKTARQLKIAKPGLHAGIIRWAIILFTFSIVLTRFGYPFDFLLMILAVAGGTACLTFVIAFGFGSIPWVPKALDKLMDK